MNTPICDFVRSYCEKETVRFHMPGHKGRPFLLPEPLDITEIKGADALYEARGIIRESERNASYLFGTKDTFYSTEGSSQVIRAMLYLAGQYARRRADGRKKSEKPEEAGSKERPCLSERPGKSDGRDKPERRIRILASRNVHKAFLYGCALLDYDVIWLPGTCDRSLLKITTSKEQLKETLEELASEDGLPDAVFVTSPDYLGTLADIRGFSEVLAAYDIPLIVDNAHGAYLHFLKTPQHPMDLGADLCCDSAHKTLPALTGCAYLHIADNDAHPEMGEFFQQNAKNALALFGSTSPSYLLLQSLDLTNAYLAEGYRDRLNDFILQIDRLKSRLKDAGYELAGDEGLKITLLTGSYGYRGNEIADLLRQQGMECEYSDDDAVVFMLTTANTSDELKQLEKALVSLPKREALAVDPIQLPGYDRVTSVREAFFLPHRTVPVKEAAGKIAASPLVSCPPAVPIVISGERIREEHLAVFKRYGITEAEVIDER